MPKLAHLLLALLLVSTATVIQAADSPPNFVIIFADDQGYQDVGCFGSPDIRTPNLDRMAAEGRKFTNFYVGAQVCSASRASLLTGCYCDRVGVTGVFFPNRNPRRGLNPDEITIAEVLKPKGYATACIGKWHLGDEKPFLPTRQGFDSYYGIPYSNDMSVNPEMSVSADIVWREGMTLDKMRTEKPKRDWVPLLRDEEVVEYPADQRTLTKRYTKEAVRFINENRQRPFFLYLPHTMPHVPLFTSENFRGSKRGIYGDVIEEIDWSVGQVLAALKAAGVDDNTLVVFTSDNGPWLSKGAHGGCALPLRDGKFTSYEGGMREPCIMRWPGRIPAGTTCSQIAATIDLLPTLAELAGSRPPQDRIIDGRSILPLLEGKPGANSPHNAYFYRTAAVRVGKWKLHIRARSTVKSQPVGKLPALHDLSTDIAEKNNLADEHPEVVERLAKLLDEHRTEIRANKRPVGTLGE